MIHLQENKLFIEINCHNASPLATLSDFKMAFNTILMHIEINTDSGKLHEDKQWALKKYAEFLNYMEMSYDQCHLLQQQCKKMDFEKFNSAA